MIPLFDKVVEIIHKNYLFLCTEHEKWNNLCDYYASIVTDKNCEDNLVFMLREMDDPHLKYSPNFNRGLIIVPLLWNGDELFWLTKVNSSTEAYKIKNINGICPKKMLEEYRNKYGSNLNILKNYILEDITFGRLLKHGVVYFNTNNGFTFQSKPLNYNLQNGQYKYNSSAKKPPTQFVQKLLRDRVLYIKVRNFYEDTDYSTIKIPLQSKSISTIIFDLRNNPGGYVGNAKKVVSDLIYNDVIISQYEVIDKRNRVYYHINPTKNGVNLNHYKIYILINANTMSSAEYIFTLAMQKAYNCILVGEGTMGMSGECQDYKLHSYGNLKVTTKKYVCGDEIVKGIVPQVLVRQNIDALINHKDEQLEYILSMEGLEL